MDRLTRSILKLIFGLVSIITFGTLSYRIIEGWNWFDCLYMTVITITTTGYREVGEMSVYGKVISMFLMFFGVGIFIYSINVIVPFLVEGRLRRWEKMLEKLENHYIVCGYGLMGREIVRELPKEGLVVIDSDINKVNLAREDGFIAIQGDATDEQTLERAGIRKAKAIICCMTDASNAFAILTARELNPSITTIAVLRSPEAEKKVTRIGVDVLLSPYRDTARKIFAILSKKISVEFIETIISGNQKLNLEKAVVENQRLVGKTLRELDLGKRTGCMVVAVVRKGEVIFPDANTKLEKGDVLYLMCRGNGSEKLSEIF